MSSYLDYAERDDVISGGARKIPIETPRGTFNVWVKRVGNNPDLRVLLLHGGPGGNHHMLEAFDSFLPFAGIEYYYYDQLGSDFSDKPDEPSLWELDRFVDEVEQVRRALGLSAENFVLFGHSWGGILAMEYALTHQQHLRGLVISNCMASMPEYTEYVRRELMPAMDPDVLAEVQAMDAAGDTENPRYSALLREHFYTQHVLRRPLADWPEPVTCGAGRTNRDIYVPMQGPSEMGMSAEATLGEWDRVDRLREIDVPALVIAGRHDTMDPDHLRMMADRLPQGRYLYCADGSHLSMYDDQETYFSGLIDFLHTM